MRNLRCYLAERLIGLALWVGPKDYLPSVVEAAQIEGRLAYENAYRADHGIRRASSPYGE